jgi:hypothetical protein
MALRSARQLTGSSHVRIKIILRSFIFVDLYLIVMESILADGYV